MSHFGMVNTEYQNFFKATLPARSCVAVKELPEKGKSLFFYFLLKI